MRTQLLAVSLLFLSTVASAQELRVSGRITDPAGSPLAGVRVEERGTLNQTLSNADGRYELRYSSPGAVIVFTHFGYRTQELRPQGAAAGDIVMAESPFAVTGIEVVGTRRVNRSAVETPVPIDVIDVPQLAQTTGRLDVNQLLQYVAPSFNANRQSGADGADHIDPATLRGLGPDQTLVLINGKRRHQSSLINIFGSRGRGNTGTDLNAIPASAIERLEILRDGASAQYGSDAIAGVINVVLKSSVDEFTGTLAGGLQDASPPSKYQVAADESTDGRGVQLGGNYGLRVGELGFLNLTAEYLTRNRTNRPADPAEFDIYRRQFGDAAYDNVGAFVNARVAAGENTALYGFGGLNFRSTDAYAWTRDPDSDRNVPAIYPNGFDPRILSDITDGSISAGVRTALSQWSLDINNTFGMNRFEYTVDGTLNASLLERSPTRFDAGGFQFAQNTTGIHFTRLFDQVASGMNVAFGGEFRVDSYEIFAGEEGSWRNYGIVERTVNGQLVRLDTLGRPAGSQGFPGYQPDNELDESRTNVGVYADLEADVADNVTLGGALRFENYSDFGSTINGKLAGRVAMSDALALRGSFSTGFRAPSLPQIYFNTTFTDFVAGEAVDKIIAHNNSAITRALGIPALDEETARNYSAGVTLRLGDFTATVDAYRVEIDDRIVLTGAFEDTDPDIGAELQRLGVGAAQFFTNAIDTRTNGIDAIVTWQRTFGPQRLAVSFAGNFNDMELGDIHTTDRLSGKEETYFGPREQHFLLASAPDSKLNLTLDYARDRFDTSLRFVRFGEVTLIDWLDTEDVYESKLTTDVSLSYRFSRNGSFTIGGANIFDVYPSQQDTETETGGLWDAVQMGFSGAFWFARLNIKM